MNNFLEIEPFEYDTFIYRIIGIPRLFQLFKSRRNVLVKPRLWEDPFENFILQSENIYGQCWTFQTTSDAMWRIYSPKSEAVRIRSTVRRLFNSLEQSQSKLEKDEVFIGRVRYIRSESLIAFAKEIIKKSTSDPNETLAQTLLVKRPAFRHEREIRLLYIPYLKENAPQPTFCYSVDPNELIDQIMIDPRFPEEKVEKLKQEIRERTKFKSIIKRSLLYAPPPDFSDEIKTIQNT